MLIFDAHLDLSMNAMEWNRDFTLSVDEIRDRERGRNDKHDRARGTVSLAEMRRGHVGLCVATLIARYVKPGNPLPGFHSPEIAWAHTQGQLAWYRAMEEVGQMRQITDLESLERAVEAWSVPTPPSDAPIGYVLSLEGADSIRTPDHLQAAYDQGLRALGPAHYGPGTYAFGTHSDGGIGDGGRQLLSEMERLGMILDATHLCDQSFWEALDHFGGRVWASHTNSRTLVPEERQFSDAQMKTLIERGAVIGSVLDAWMLVPDWQRGTTTPEETQVTLEHVVDHIDHVCQLAGNAEHAAIGSDLDGGFGKEQTAIDLETIADLQKIAGILDRRGYAAADIARIMHGNWIEFLRQAWS